MSKQRPNIGVLLNNLNSRVKVLEENVSSTTSDNSKLNEGINFENDISLRRMNEVFTLLNSRLIVLENLNNAKSFNISVDKESGNTVEPSPVVQENSEVTSKLNEIFSVIDELKNKITHVEKENSELKRTFKYGLENKDLALKITKLEKDRVVSSTTIVNAFKKMQKICNQYIIVLQERLLH